MKTVTVTLSGRIGSRLGKKSAADNTESRGLLSASMKRALETKKGSVLGKKAADDRSIKSRLGPVGGKVRPVIPAPVQAISQGLFGAERNASRLGAKQNRMAVEEDDKWGHDMYFASGQARQLPPHNQEDDDTEPTPARAPLRTSPVGRLMQLGASSAGLKLKSNTSRNVAVHKKGRGNFKYGKD